MKVRVDESTDTAWLEDADGIYHDATTEDLVAEIKRLRRHLAQRQSVIQALVKRQGAHDFLGRKTEERGL